GEIFLEKVEHAFEGKLLAGFVVVRARLAGEGVACVVRVKLEALQVRFQLGFQGLPLVRGGKSFSLPDLIMVCEVALHRDFNLGHVTQLRRRDPVERSGSIDFRHERGPSEGQGAPHAEPSHADLLTALGQQVPYGTGADVLHGARPVQVAHQVTRLLVVRGHLAPVQVRHDGHGLDPFTDVPPALGDLVVHAPPLL
ncbi:hypothetical protein EGW08_003315, partial [Elysia chlorotica]